MRAVAGDDVGAIVEAIGRGRCVLCLGGELTADGSLRRLIGKLLEALPDAADARALLERRPLMAADHVRRRLGERFADELKRLTGGEAVPELLALLGTLPFQAVLTTSYDGAVERAFARGGALPTVITPRDVAALDKPPRGRFVFKLLGDPTRPDTVVWGAADLQAALAQGGYRGVVDELFRARSFLFLGFDWSDAELAVLLERILSSAGRGEHWAALSHLEPLEREELAAVYGIRVLDGVESTDLARALHAAVQARPPVPADDDVDGWLLRLNEDPTNADVLERLEAVEATLKRRGDHERLIELHVGRVAVEPEARARAGLLAESARLLEVELGDPERALTALLAAYREAPSRTRWEALERLTAATGRFGELEGELAAQVTSLPEVDRADAWAHVAAIRHHKLGDLDGALAAADQALGLEPDHAAAIDARLALLRTAGRWRELSLALGRAVLAEVSLARKAERYTELARLFESELGDPAQAAACYRLALEADPWAGEARAGLEELLARRGEVAQLIELLEQRAERVSPAEQVILRRRMAELAERLGDRERAIAHLERLLVLDPNDAPALASLERLYHAGGRLHELLAVLERQLAITPVEARAPLLARIGATADEIGQTERARAAWHELWTREPGRADAFEALLRLEEGGGAWDRVAQLLTRRAELAPADERAGLWSRAAHIAGERQGDEATAESLFVRALEADPTHGASLQGLAQIYRRRGELRKAARLLSEAVEHTPHRVERTRLLVEAAELRERIDEPDAAITLYQRALESDPEHVEAAERVSELLWRAGRHGELVHILQPLATREAPPAIALARWARLGAAARTVGDADTAQKAWRKALALEPTDRDALRGLAGLLFDARHYGEAQSLYEKLLAAHERSLAPEEAVEAHHRLGVCHRAAGRDAAAREQFALACAIDPTHRPSRLMQLELGTQDPQAVIDAKRALVPTANRAEQIRLYLEIGDLYLDRLDDPVSSMAAWEAGLQVAPDDVRLLHRCLGVSIEQKAWRDALALLDRLIAGQPNPETRAKYQYTAGMICLEHLGRFGDAADHLWASVEGDPGYKRATQSLEQMLRDHKSWKQLVRFFQFMLQRLEPVDNDEKRAEQLRLWSELAALYLDRLRDPEAAIVALEVARRLDPSPARRQRLATVCIAAGGRHLETAIAEHRALLVEDKARIASYRALKELCENTGHALEAAACAEALACLKPDEEPAPPAAAPTSPKQALTPELLARLRHPDESSELTVLFATLAPAVIASRAQRDRVALQRKRLLVADDARPFARALRQAASAFGLPPPPAYTEPEQQAPVTLTCAVDGQKVTPVLVLGAPLVGAGRDEATLAFEAARAVVQLRPELAVRLLLPLPHELGHMIDAVMALAGEAAGTPPTGELAKTTQALRTGLPAPAVDQLAAIGHRLRSRSLRAEPAAVRWLHATDLSINRAAYAVAGDLRRCAQLLKAEPRPATALPTPNRILDLIWSATTEEVVAARRHLLG